MNTTSGFGAGVVAGILLSLAAISAHWLITPARHPNATSANTIFAWALIALGVGGFAWLYLHNRGG
jgi:hypothetical protein